MEVCHQYSRRKAQYHRVLLLDRYSLQLTSMTLSPTFITSYLRMTSRSLAYGNDPAKIVSELNLCLEGISKWCLENSMTVNTDKTEFLLFHKAHDTIIQPVPGVMVGNVKIQQSYKFKYLGLLLDCSLTFKHHFSHVQNKVSSVLGKLYSVKRCYLIGY